MSRPVTDDAGSSFGTAEHDATSLPRGFTAWHQFLAQVLRRTRTPGLDVHCFVKLGTLPLEADIIILQLDKDADLGEFGQFFGFLLPCLRRYLILEFKSPDDRLTYDDFNTVRAYAMLCKRAYPIEQDAEIAVAMLYSHTAADFFDRCARDGYHFAPTQPGVRTSSPLPLSFHAVDLVAIGEQQPAHPINLLSARRKSFGKSGLLSRLGPFDVLYEEVFFTELKKMRQSHAPGAQELLGDAQSLHDLILSRCSPEELIQRLSLAERLHGLGPEERLRGMPAEERLRGMPAEERLRGMPAEERLRGLDASERARLLELLLKPTES